MLHIVRRFHLKSGVKQFLTSEQHGEMGRKFWDLIVNKAKKLKDKELRVKRQLLEYYHKETDISIPPRAIYANDIYI